MKPRQPQSDLTTAGFTLIEMLVVVIIIGVLASIAAPDWFAYLMGRRVVTVRDEVRQTLEEAQNIAITRRQSQTVYFYPDEALPTVGLLGGSATSTTTIQRQAIGSDGVRPGMLTLSATADSVTFDYRGVIIHPEINDSTPFVVEVFPTDVGGRRSCVIVRTLLGNFANEDNAACDI